MTWWRPVVVGVVGCAALAACGGGGSLTDAGGDDGRADSVTGHLVLSGGPSPGVELPLDGTIHFTDSARGRGGAYASSLSLDVSTDHDGRFAASLPPGTYVVTGEGGSYTGCASVRPVVVSEGSTTRLEVVCPIP